jgi:hypothetical protein
MTPRDPMLEAFLSGAKRDVFHSVEHRHQIWREDPFDVECVHEHARSQFQRLLAQATTPPGLDAGRILLLLGEAGSGKTHLLRAFRNHVHVNGLGFVGYMQMTTSITSYSRYLMSNLVDSLDQPYYESLGTSTGLLRLSGAIAARCGDEESIRALVEDPSLDANGIVDRVERAADRLVAQPRYADLDLDLVRALLFLQRQDTGLKKRVVKYLRCQELSPRDAKLLGDLTARRDEEDAQHLVEQLGRLMWALDSRSMVLCVDQFEDAYQNEDAEGLFRRAVQSLCAVADQVPSSIVVIACIEDYYAKLKTRLTRSMIDRLEHDPPVVRLEGERSAQEIEAILQQRLDYLYETSNVKPGEGPATPLHPIPRDFVAEMSRLRIRDVLDECHRFRDACVTAGIIVAPERLVEPAPPHPPVEDRTARAAREKIQQDWNDCLAQFEDKTSDSDAELAKLVGWAIESCAEELGGRWRFDASARGSAVEIRISVPGEDGQHRLAEEIHLAVCNKGTQGGGLAKQLEGALKAAEHRLPVMLRSGEFAFGPRTLVAKKLAEVVKGGGRKAVIQESDRRRMAALRKFRKDHAERPQLPEWLFEEKHLSRLLPIIHILDLDHMDRFESAAVARADRMVSEERPSRLDTRAEPERDAPRTTKSGGGAAPIHERSVSGEGIIVGSTGELIPQDISLDVETLNSHAAFLGSTGSGKTTLALNVIEQLLLRGIPAILVDRKGDLCAYARDRVWETTPANPTLASRRDALADRVDVALFTPGHPEGRQLALSLVPRGLAGLKDLDRDQAAGYAAHALGDMLGYKHTSKDKALRTILAQAFRLFAAHGDSDRLDIESLIAFIHDEDPALVGALGRLDIKLFKDLVQDLEVLKLSSSELLSRDGEELDAELLLGLGAHARPGKTRLSIISTKFLGDSTKILFWISQLLLSLSRWVTRTPSPCLQAVVLFDEADLYLPALSRPATKAPMEDLLRRARSGGLGLLLATQSPGDLDYKCRDNLRSWFVGRVTQAVALEKMKPLLSEARVNVTARIPGQGVGEFHLLQDGRVTAFKAAPSMLRTEQVPEAEILALAARRREALAE